MADKNSKKAIRSDIEATTIAEELKLMYLMAGATQSVVEDVMKIGASTVGTASSSRTTRCCQD